MVHPAAAAPFADVSRCFRSLCVGTDCGTAVLFLFCPVARLLQLPLLTCLKRSSAVAGFVTSAASMRRRAPVSLLTVDTLRINTSVGLSPLAPLMSTIPPEMLRLLVVSQWRINSSLTLFPTGRTSLSQMNPRRAITIVGCPSVAVTGTVTVEVLSPTVAAPCRSIDVEGDVYARAASGVVNFACGAGCAKMSGSSIGDLLR